MDTHISAKYGASELFSKLKVLDWELAPSNTSLVLPCKMIE